MELFPASQIAESLGNNDRLMEIILERNNIIRAWKQVCANNGAPGVDGMKTSQLGNYLAKHWPKIEQDLLNCKHKPLPLKRKEIPKPDGGVRLLGIPTVLDRFIQQAISQILEQVCDFMIFCKSRKAAERVMQSISRFLIVKLKLKVNQDKSAVSRPWLRKFLGFTYFQMCGQSKIRIHAKSMKRFKDKVRELTSRKRGKSLWQVIQELNQYFRRWWNYFRLTEAKSFLKGLKIWIMRRLRSLVWKQWKNPQTRVRNLEKLGVAHHDAMLCGNARKKYWRMSKIKWVAIAMPERYFIDKGLYLPGN